MAGRGRPRADFKVFVTKANAAWDDLTISADALKQHAGARPSPEHAEALGCLRRARAVLRQAYVALVPDGRRAGGMGRRFGVPLMERTEYEQLWRCRSCGSLVWARKRRQHVTDHGWNEAHWGDDSMLTALFALGPEREDLGEDDDDM